MNKKIINTLFAFLLVGLFSLPVISNADTLNVCKSGCTYNKVGSAVTDAKEGDVVQVAAGTYEEDMPISVNKKISLKGEGKDKTIIKSTYKSNRPLLYLNDTLLISDLTVDASSLQYSHAAAISVIDGFTVDNISNVKIVNSYYGIQLTGTAKINLIDSLEVSNCTNGIYAMNGTSNPVAQAVIGKINNSTFNDISDTAIYSANEIKEVKSINITNAKRGLVIDRKADNINGVTLNNVDSNIELGTSNALGTVNSLTNIVIVKPKETGITLSLNNKIMLDTISITSTDEENAGFVGINFNKVTGGADVKNLNIKGFNKYANSTGIKIANDSKDITIANSDISDVGLSVYALNKGNITISKSSLHNAKAVNNGYVMAKNNYWGDKPDFKTIITLADQGQVVYDPYYLDKDMTIRSDEKYQGHEIALDPLEYTLNAGEELDLIIDYLDDPADADDPDFIKWVSNDKTIAEVLGNCKLVARSCGGTTIITGTTKYGQVIQIKVNVTGKTCSNPDENPDNPGNPDNPNVPGENPDTGMPLIYIMIVLLVSAIGGVSYIVYAKNLKKSN